MIYSKFESYLASIYLFKVSNGNSQIKLDGNSSCAKQDLIARCSKSSETENLHESLKIKIKLMTINLSMVTGRGLGGSDRSWC